MKVKFTVGLGDASHTETFDYDDNVTDAVLEEDWKQWIGGYLDGSFERLESK